MSVQTIPVPERLGLQATLKGGVKPSCKKRHQVKIWLKPVTPRSRTRLRILIPEVCFCYETRPICVTLIAL